MADIKKVVKGLECCTKWDSCSDCHYQTPNEYDVSECTEHLHNDALELLKEQQKTIDFQHNALRGSSDMIHILFEKLDKIVLCKDCKHWYPLTKTCNNVDGACCQSYVAEDWFCADGEKRE